MPGWAWLLVGVVSGSVILGVIVGWFVSKIELWK